MTDVPDLAQALFDSVDRARVERRARAEAERCPGCNDIVYPEDTHCHCPPDADERTER